jgi:predicted kinase
MLKLDMKSPILFILSGLPAAGKTALAQLVAKEYHAVYLRIDTIEQGLRDLCDFDVKGEGYRLSYKIAIDNLKLGNPVVADACNPIDLVRKEWQETAKKGGGAFINIEIVCSDKAEHQKRVENRKSNVEGLQLPGWEDVENREYHPWKSERIVIDTANKSIEKSFSELNDRIKSLIKI